MRYDKLVRDNVPFNIQARGKKPVTHIADDREYLKKLDEKLQEEINEFLFAKNEEEMADILEVLDAIVEARGLSRKKIKQIKQKKAKEAGLFSKRIILDEVT